MIPFVDVARKGQGNIDRAIQILPFDHTYKLLVFDDQIGSIGKYNGEGLNGSSKRFPARCRRCRTKYHCSSQVVEVVSQEAECTCQICMDSSESNHALMSAKAIKMAKFG
jgi:hypothetical protein